MRTLTRLGIGVIVLALGYAGLTYLIHDGDIARPPRTGTRPDGRVYAVVQLCWFPAETGGVVRVVLGTAERVEVETGLTCKQPFTRKGLVSYGDRITLGWTMSPGQPRSAQYRITINNHEVKQASRDGAVGAFNCVVGVRPCTAPGV